MIQILALETAVILAIATLFVISAIQRELQARKQATQRPYRAKTTRRHHRAQDISRLGGAGDSEQASVPRLGSEQATSSRSR